MVFKCAQQEKERERDRVQFILLLSFTYKIYANVQVIQNDSGAWKLVMVDENKHSGLAPPIFQRVLRSNVFHMLTLLLVLVDTCIAASLRFDHHTKLPERKLDEFYYAEVITEYMLNKFSWICLCQEKIIKNLNPAFKQRIMSRT